MTRPEAFWAAVCQDGFEQLPVLGWGVSGLYRYSEKMCVDVFFTYHSFDTISVATEKSNNLLDNMHIASVFLHFESFTVLVFGTLSI